MKTLITTVPFGAVSSLPTEMLSAAGIDWTVNPIGRKLVEDELIELLNGDTEAIIAGTEPITRRVMESCKPLKVISRVGIGLDSVDLLAARDLGIEVFYTPDAPAPAVSELTIGLMISLIRHVGTSNAEMSRGDWSRPYGDRLSNLTIGIIGAGRIGSRVIRKISRAFGTPRFLVHDIDPNFELSREVKLEWCGKNRLLKESDVVSVHVPLTGDTRKFIGEAELSMMKQGAMLINTARGGIVCEDGLLSALRNGKLAAAAVDVFEKEPYTGPLAQLDNCIVSCHLGSMTKDCRSQMEIEATQKVVDWHKGLTSCGDVPEAEFAIQKGMIFE